MESDVCWEAPIHKDRRIGNDWRVFAWNFL